MSSQPDVAPNLEAGEHLARIVAANGEVLFVSSQGYDDEDDLIFARERARRTLNTEIDNDPALRARVDALMARRDAGEPPLGNLTAPAPTEGDSPPPRNKVAETLSSRAGIGAPTLDRLFGFGAAKDEQG